MPPWGPDWKKIKVFILPVLLSINIVHECTRTDGLQNYKQINQKGCGCK